MQNATPVPEESSLVGGADELDGSAQPLADLLRLPHEVGLLELAAGNARLVGDEHDLVAGGPELLQLARHLRVEDPPVVGIRREYLRAQLEIDTCL